MQDHFLHTTQNNSSNGATILFFIPGNPGLIEYYHSFLKLVSEDADLHTKDVNVVAGFSHGGFEIVSSNEVDEEVKCVQWPQNAPQGPIFRLKDQVELTFLRIEALAGMMRRTKGTVPKIVLIGHSVGAYIALEVIRMWHDKYRSSEKISQNFPYIILGSILLTPTIFHIARSPSGQKLTLTTYVPYLAGIAQAAAVGLRLSLPRAWMHRLISNVTGMTGHALEVTVSWLSSKGGVYQAIELGKDEMKTITEDRWGDEVWGAVTTAEDSELKPSKLVFYFAHSDHWVSDVTREQVIEARGRTEHNTTEQDSWKPKMIVEEPGKLTHDWCLNEEQISLVSRRVLQWVREILET